MKKLTWLGIGAATVTTVVLVTRKSQAQPTGSAPQMYGELVKVPLAVPAGWRRVTSAEVTALPELRDQAVALRSTPGFTTMQYGTISPFVGSDGKTYATWIEQHFHEPGGSVRPWGYHHGVTLLAKI